jgi:plastocyanin
MRSWMRGALAGLGLMAGCKSTPAPQPQPAQPAQVGVAPATQLDPTTLGTVAGVVKLNGNAPSPVEMDTTMDPACSIGGAGRTESEQYVVKDGKLANVYVYVKSGPPAAMKMGVSGSRAVLDQKGCSYAPHVVAIQMGGTVEFRNDDATMHNIHTLPPADESSPNPGIDFAQGPHGVAQVRQFRQPGVMIPVRCSLHPWMNAFINVAATPFFAVTGAEGAFELKGLPAGDYTIGAVQEMLGEQEIHITVKPQATAKAEFTYAMK